MKKKSGVFGIIVLAAVIGFSLAGCEDLTSLISTPVVTSVTVSPSNVSVEKGGNTTFSVTVNGENNPPQTVTWSISQTGKHAQTTINSNGVLTVNAAETLTTLTVVATSTANVEKSGTATVTIDGGTSPNPITGNLGNYRFGLQEDGVSANYSQAVWELTGENLTNAKTAGARLVLVLQAAPSSSLQLIWQGPENQIWWKQVNILGDNGNILNANAASWNESAKTLTINLSALDDYNSFTVQPSLNIIIAYYGGNSVNTLGIVSANLTGTGITPVVTGVTVSPDTATIDKGETQQFTATVNGTGSVAQTVTWSIVQTNKHTGTTINSSGLLTVSASETLTSLTVRAASTVDNTKYGQATVTVSGGSSEGSYSPPAQCYACGQSGCSCNTLFSLYSNTVIQGSALGASSILWNDVDGLQGAGGAFGVIPNGSKKAVKITATAAWNGVDLQNPHFQFKAGDVVVAVVKVVSYTATGSAEILLNGKPGAWGPLGANPAVAAGQIYTLNRTLSATDITNIAGSTPPAIRFQMNNVSAYVTELYELMVIRPAGGVDPGEPDPGATVTNVTVTPDSATIDKGKTQQFSAAVNGTGNVAQTVTWSIVQTNKHAGTTINSSGLLTVSASETLTSLTVRAASTVDNTKYGQATVSIISGVTSILMQPAEVTVSAGALEIFYAEVYVNGERDYPDLIWSIDETGKHADTTIYGNNAWGELNVSGNETLATLTVRVTLASDPTITAKTKVTIFFPVSFKVESFTISLAPGFPAVRASRSTKLVTNIVTSGRLPDGYDPNDDIEWTIEGTGGSNTNFRGTTINENGVLSVAPDELGAAEVAVCSYNRTGVKGPECTRCYFLMGDDRHYTSILKIQAEIKSRNTAWEKWQYHWDGDHYQRIDLTLYQLGDNRGFERGPTQYREITSNQTINLTDLMDNNVYLAYVNPTTTSVASNNSNVTISNPAESLGSLKRGSSVSSQTNNGRPVSGSVNSRTFANGNSIATAFNALPAKPGAGKRSQTSSLLRGNVPLSEPLTVGTSKRTFYDVNNTYYEATLLATGTYSNIWVPENYITVAQSQRLAGKFDIIYPAMTNVFGYENGGGPGGDGGMDGDKKIQILIYYSDTDALAGYFYGRDIHQKSVYSFSNEAEMFYINAHVINEDEEWIYQALAHEHQHLINYSRKNIGKGLTSPTWYDEFLSAMTEEIVYPFLYPGQQSRPMRLGNYFADRLREYNYTESQMTAWSQASGLSAFHYAEKGIFAGYMLRNYGGASLAKTIMDNDLTGMDSIVAAITEVNGTDPDFFTKFIESFFFNESDKITLSRSLNTFSNSSTEVINGTTYTIAGFDIDDIFTTGSFYKTPLSLLNQYSANVYIPDSLKTISGNISITVRPPEGGGRLFLIVR